MTAVSAINATGVICDLRTAWTFADGDLPPDRVEVIGDRGSVELVVGAALDVYADGRRTSSPADEGDDPLRSEHDHFLACVRDRSHAPALDLRHALIGLKLADAAIEVSAPRPGDRSLRMSFTGRRANPKTRDQLSRAPVFSSNRCAEATSGDIGNVSPGFADMR